MASASHSWYAQSLHTCMFVCNLVMAWPISIAYFTHQILLMSLILSLYSRLDIGLENVSWSSEYLGGLILWFNINNHLQHMFFYLMNDLLHQPQDVLSVVHLVRSISWLMEKCFVIICQKIDGASFVCCLTIVLLWQSISVLPCSDRMLSISPAFLYYDQATHHWYPLSWRIDILTIFLDVVHSNMVVDIVHGICMAGVEPRSNSSPRVPFLIVDKHGINPLLLCICA